MEDLSLFKVTGRSKDYQNSLPLTNPNFKLSINLMPLKKFKTVLKKRLDLIIIILALIIFALFTVKFLLPSKTATPQPSPSPSVSINMLNGIYRGELLCADCPGIEETLILAGKDDSGTYILEDVYKEKSAPPFLSDGTWEKVNENILKLNPKSGNPSYFQILENGNLQILDSKMQKIDSLGNQILTKKN